MLLPPEDLRPDAAAPVLVVGGGACGLIAALAAREAGADVLVLERDRTPSGSTALSSGFVPAAGTRWQRAGGIGDTPELFAADMVAKTRGTVDREQALLVARTVGPALEWLADAHGLPFEVLQGFRYPGHMRLRMHAVPERTGAALQARLLAAAAAAGIDILTEARAVALFADAAGLVRGVRIARPDGRTEDIGCGALVLACSGFGGDAELVRRHIPGMADALYFGHAGNTGDALRWGLALGAATADLG
ncbi:MAG: FAD-dependent oxidoreductase, partial [Acidisphaera sp.]|nr:FAD-dependent oxidoreductase [Acidisphaera sp.]